MSHLEDYQTTEIQELFNCELIDDVLEEYDNDQITEQQKAVLRFIANNPESQYIKLQNTFRMSDVLVVDLVMNYGAKTKEMNELRDLREKIKSS